MAETKQEINEQGEALGLGERLKQAREAKKLSLDQVSAQLRIAKEWLDSIEKEAWAALPSRTYARGYFMSYVRFLGLPEDTLLSLFNLQYAEPTKTASTLNQKQSLSLKAKVLVIIVPLVLITTAWFSWQFLFDTDKQNKEAVFMGKSDSILYSQVNETVLLNVRTHNSYFDHNSK